MISFHFDQYINFIEEAKYAAMGCFSLPTNVTNKIDIAEENVFNIASAYFRQPATNNPDAAEDKAIKIVQIDQS